MGEANYKLRLRKGDFEVEVQGDKDFVVTKFEELTKGKIVSGKPGEVVTAEVGEFPTSLAEFVKLKGDPRGHQELTAIFAYWLFKREKIDSFNVRDMESCYSQTRVPKSTNLSEVMNRNQGKGLFVRSEAEKDGLVAWRITRSGEEYVEKMK